MKTLFYLFITFLLLNSCKTKTTIDPPPIIEAEEVIKIEDSYKPIGNDFIYGKVIHNDSTTTDLVAIKLNINDSVCVNSYGNFDGDFSFRYDKNMINESSNLEFVFRDYAIKRISFVDFLKNKTVELDKNGDLVKYDQYRTFYEAIRACTR
ncbi:hypothetical protein [Aquimarina latercula]|uniref:hypothetical protein n=1 Tax=Aquimarina latercula TaxID=987 RepID=UPI000426E7B6|nr:hypothetical protein [Aquimarina latercula]